MQPDIIVTRGNLTTIALQRETRTIPIVFVRGADPVTTGMVARLDRPGAQRLPQAGEEQRVRELRGWRSRSMGTRRPTAIR